uniref:Alpha/beta hydrolase fold-3 domain-containing protein n=1 Tax=Lotharella oceanica TaxID=641309 RepID=A0A7S2XG71_9EUKA
MESSARVYTKEGESWENPMAWPSLATENDVKGFPPTLISVNEFDPLKDEGLAFYRLLLNAGGKAQAKIICGTTHAADTMTELVPEIVRSTQSAIVAYADSL